MNRTVEVTDQMKDAYLSTASEDAANWRGELRLEGKLSIPTDGYTMGELLEMVPVVSIRGPDSAVLSLESIGEGKVRIVIEGRPKSLGGLNLSIPESVRALLNLISSARK